MSVYAMIVRAGKKLVCQKQEDSGKWQLYNRFLKDRFWPVAAQCWVREASLAASCPEPTITRQAVQRQLTERDGRPERLLNSSPSAKADGGSHDGKWPVLVSDQPFGFFSAAASWLSREAEQAFTRRTA